MHGKATPNEDSKHTHEEIPKKNPHLAYYIIQTRSIWNFCHFVVREN